MFWNRKKGLPRGDITYLEGQNLVDFGRPKGDLTPYLKDIFYEKKYAEYVGATLSFPDEDDKIILINIRKAENEEEKFWLCMNFIKYKSRESVIYDTAEEYLLSRKDREIEIAKLFLERTNA